MLSHVYQIQMWNCTAPSLYIVAVPVLFSKFLEKGVPFMMMMITADSSSPKITGESVLSGCGKLSGGCTGRTLTCMVWSNLCRGKLGHWLRMFESEDHRGECPVWVRQAFWWLYRPILDLHFLEQFGQGKTWSLVEEVWVVGSFRRLRFSWAARTLPSLKFWTAVFGKGPPATSF